MPLLLIPTLAALLLMLSTPSLATCPDAGRIETLRSSIADPPADDYERVVLALALALEEGCTLREQRDAAIGERNNTRTQRDRQAMRGDMLEGRVRLLEEQLAAPDVEQWTPPVWLDVGLDVVAVGGGVCAGYALGAGLPGEVTVGCTVGGLGALVVSLVLALVTR